jgi:Nuclease-related domain
MNAPDRSPLKDKPLRHAGQSLEEERKKPIDDKIETPLLMALMYVLLAGLEWWRDYKDMKPHPWAFTLVAVVAVAFTGWRIWRVRPKLRALTLGAEGEKVVGQYLDGLRAKGYVVFHDIVGPTFNIDHVLIGPCGVFTVETKTWSKPARGDARIVFDGDSLTVAGRIPDRDPIAQVRGQAAWLRQLLQDSTGRLPAFLEREPERLAPEDVRLAAFHLSRFIRVGERQRGKVAGGALP